MADLVARRHSEHVVDGEIRRGNPLACKSDLCSMGRIAANFAVLLDAWELCGQSCSIEVIPTATTVSCDLASLYGWLEHQSGECGDKRLFNDNRVMMS